MDNRCRRRTKVATSQTSLFQSEEDKMRRVLLIAFVATTCSLATVCFGQSASNDKQQTVSLCSLQQNIGAGNRESVRVSGIYGPGLDRTVLEEPSCPGEGTWVELDLQSSQNKEKLRKMLNQSRRAYVVVEGEFYGPPLPDPKLPESIRKSYHPGWGHLGGFKTKLVVHAIREVKAAPEQTSDLPTDKALPTVAGAAVPFYPPLARVARLNGTGEGRVMP
jgi:hypothetical protein